jgi:hypothetical protein
MCARPGVGDRLADAVQVVASHTNRFSTTLRLLVGVVALWGRGYERCSMWTSENAPTRQSVSRAGGLLH